jgi:hypothetical protein
MSESASPEPGPLSVEDAIAVLVPTEETNPAPEAPVEAAEEQEEPQGETSAPEDAAEGAENPEDGEEAEVEAEPEKLAAPLYWKPEAKAVFDAMTPEQQAVVLAQEGPREQATAKAKAEAAEIRQRAEADLGKVKVLADGLAQALPEWQQAFASKWGTKAPDWVAVAREHGTDAATIAKMEYEADQQRLTEAQTKASEAQALAHEQFIRTEGARLAEIEPELADPEKGPERRTKVGEYLLKRGIPKDALRQISAAEMSIAYDAMRYRELQAAAQAKPKPKPTAPPPRATIRPSAGQPSSSTERSASTLANRFAQTRSVDDAVALLAAKG